MDFGLARIAKFLFDFKKFVSDDRCDAFGLGENVPEIRNECELLGELIFDFLAFEARESLELHLEDRLSLTLGQAEFRHEITLGLLACVGSTDGGDYGIDVVECDFEALQYMCPLLGDP